MDCGIWSPLYLGYCKGHAPLTTSYNYGFQLWGFSQWWQLGTSGNYKRREHALHEGERNSSAMMPLWEKWWKMWMSVLYTFCAFFNHHLPTSTTGEAPVPKPTSGKRKPMLRSASDIRTHWPSPIEPLAERARLPDTLLDLQCRRHRRIIDAWNEYNSMQHEDPAGSSSEWIKTPSEAKWRLDTSIYDHDMHRVA